MTNHTPTPDEASQLLEQAQQTQATIRGNAGWPTITIQLVMGATTSMFLLATPNGFASSTWPLFAAMMFWILVPLLFNLRFSSVAKNGFPARWGIYMGIWGICWMLAMFIPSARIAMAVVIAAASIIGAYREAAR